MPKILKIFLYFIGGLLVLVLAVFAWLNTTSGKRFIRDRVVIYLHNKLKTKVAFGELYFTLPKEIGLKDVLFLDQRNDTLIAAKKLEVNISMFELLQGKVDVQKIDLEGGIANLYRIAPDTNYNFTYITAAFASPPDSAHQDKPTDTSGRLQIGIKKLILKNLAVRFNDYTAGNRFAIVVNDLDADISKVDPYAMDFRLKRLYINGLTSSFMLDTSYLGIKPKDTTTTRLPYILADELDIRNVNFSFADNLGKTYFDLLLGRLLAHPKEIDLNKQEILVNDLLLDTTTYKMVLGVAPPKPAIAKADTSAIPKWRILVNTAKLNDIDYQMDDQSKPRLAYGIDYSHMHVQNLVFNADRIFYTTDTIAANIKHLSATEQSGFVLKELHTDFMYYPQGAQLQNLYLETANSVLQNYAAVTYPSLDAVQKQMQAVQLKLNLKNSVVGMKDVILFAPQLRSQPLFQKYGNDRLRVNAVLNGSLAALNINTLQLSGLGNSYVDINGRLNGLPDANRLNYNLNIRKLQTNKTVVNTFLPSSLQKQVNLPNTFAISGKLSGTATSYNTDLVANTSDGNATIKGTLAIAVKNRERFDMVITTNQLNVGKIIRQDSIMGRITAKVAAKGQSFDVKYMNAMLKGDIQSAAFMGYAYHSINFNAKVASQVVDAHIVSNDPNAHLQLDGQANMRGKYPAIVAKLMVDSANLQALKLYPDELRFRGTVDADIPELNPDYPRGTVIMDRPTVVLKGQRYFLDSMYVSSQPNADSGNYIVVNADAIDAVITGKTPLTQIGNIIEDHVNRHYALNKTNSTRTNKAIPADYNLHMEAIVRDHPLMHVLLPGLQSMDTVHMNADLTPRNMALNVSIPSLTYNNMYLANGKVNVTEADSALTYAATLDRFAMNQMQFWYASVRGDVRQQTITTRAIISDSSKKERFSIGGVYHQHPDRQELHIDDGLMLNYKTWSVSQPNAIVIGKDGLYVQNFRISNGGESISLNSNTQQFSSPMTIAINNFLISNITEIVQRDSNLANGVLNANLTVRDIMKSPKANGTLSIQDLSAMGDTIGNVALQINEASANLANAKMTITGRGNDITLAGNYYPEAVNGNNFNLNLNIHALNIKSMEGLAMNQIRKSSGYIRGNLKVTGTMAKPIVVGELHTDSLNTTIAAIGSPYRMPHETIRFTANGIEFQNFRILDDAGNAAMVDGTINTTNLTNMQLALKIHARKWQALNTTAKDNKLFYGKLVISTDMNVSGTTMAPDITGNLTVHDTTKFTVAIPSQAPGIEERKGIVEFVDMSDTNRYKLLMARDTVPKMLAMHSGTKLNMNVAIEKNAEFNVLIDQSTGDFLRVRGAAALNTTMDPDGTVGLTGTYELVSGSYEFNYNFIKRHFDIQKGSTITFGGDPLQSQVNITAVYTADIAPYDLIEKQVSDPSQLVYFKQRLPFQVQLKLTGVLMQPVIGFDIVLPEDQHYMVSSEVTTLVESKLAELRNNPTDMTKQVFAVLVLNRFISDNPFESGGGTSAAFIARQSASRYISEQLNNLTRNLVSGLEINADLQSTEDYTTGQLRERTDLNVSATKRLMNDRLAITVGNNFNLEGASPNTNAQNSSLVPGNLAADYKLTSDGRYTVRIYRRNEIDDILEGYISETGTSFIVNYDYNRFRNLFINRKKRLREQQQKAIANKAANR